jgi:FMN phosphatase YigB (HAD superfamily)
MTNATSFALFGTLVTASWPDDPATAVGRELRERGVDVPDDWAEAYTETHIDPPEGAEIPLPAHVSAALSSRGVDAPGNAPRRAVVSAFDPEIETRSGAAAAITAASERGPVGILANAAAPELVRRTLIRASFDRDAFDAVVSSAACGWRKPHSQAFETVARQLDVSPEALTHVGGDPETDGGITAVGGTFRDLREHSLAELTAEWRNDVDSQ